MKRSPWRHLTGKWAVIALVIAIGAGGIAWASTRTSAPEFQTAIATLSNVVERVSVTGTISPIDRADLAFQKSGVLAAVYVKIGDSVKKGDRIASLSDGDGKAALASAEATLADASRNLTSQEVAVQETAVLSARTGALNASQDALVKVQGALLNSVDTLFLNPQGPNPTISIHVDSVITRNSINESRLAMSDLLRTWSAELLAASDSRAEAVASDSRAHLGTAKAFINDLYAIVNRLNPATSGVSQATISGYLAVINSALTVVNSSIDVVTAAQTALLSAQSNYDLRLAGNSSESIAALSAKASQVRVQLEQGTMLSPIDGIITKADPHEGEFVAAGQTAFSIQNTAFKIEAYVAEADIAKVAVGNSASSTLDAYGSEADFPAQVIMIDPAETVLEGVPTYKVTLVFMQPDARIRSGMTANLEIMTHERIGVIAVPYRAISDIQGSKTVRLVDPSGASFVEMPVVTGLKGSDGIIEIVSGLSAGDKVVTYVK